MALVRASAQSSSSLSASYQQLVNLGKSTPHFEVGRQMLALLPKLEKLCDDLPVWGLTSHLVLCLLARDDYTSPPYVTISATSGGFQISYLMHPSEAPWPNARVEGYARSPREALVMVRTAMVRCGGWPSLREY